MSQTASDDLRDVVVESVNARDPDLLTLADDVVMRNGMGDRLEQILERWPRVLLTRADLEGRPVAAVWLPDRNERYVRIGHLEFEVDGGGAHMSVVGERSPDVVAEAPAGLEVAEWESGDLADSWGDWWV
ncbi:MAG: hypothetical protein WB239_10955 [Acidimicrobiia bacterium]